MINQVFDLSLPVILRRAAVLSEAKDRRAEESIITLSSE